MKRFLLVMFFTMSLVALTSGSAFAATITVRPSAGSHTVYGKTHIDFRAAMSRAARINVAIYSGTTKIRSLSPRTYARTVSVAWDLKNAAGAYVKPGTYTYVITATAGTSRGRARGTRAVWSPWIPASARVNRFFGAYVKGVPDTMQPVVDLQSRLGSKAEVVNFYVALSEGFPANRTATIKAQGAKPLITLEFWDHTRGVNQPSWSLDEIASGAHDARIRAFARGAAQSGTKLWVRPLHEMNGNWYPWSGTVNGNTPSDYVPAFRHIVDVFRSEGATNVAFVWCPNNDSVPNTAANSIASYWPGDAYVDVIGLDGYNFGTSFSWSAWRSFSSTFRSAYAAVTPLSSKPIVVCETGCSTSGGSKGAWTAEMFRAIPASFPRIVGVVWFNTNAECDWRIDSCALTTSYFRSSLATF